MEFTPPQKLSHLRPTGGPATVVWIKTAAAILRCLRPLAVTIGFVAIIGTQLSGAEPSAAFDYQTGDKATQDVITPIPFVVFDPARTETLRQAEARKATPIFRYVAALAPRADLDLRNDFARSRDVFAALLEDAFHHAPPLLAGEFAQPQFQELTEAFRRRVPVFPLSTNLAELWALGDSGEVVLEKWLRELQRWSGRQVRGDNLPPGERLAPAQVRLVSVPQTNSPLTLATVDRQGRNVAKTNLISITRLRQEIQRQTGDGDKTALAYIAGFLQPNCFFDEALTQEARARRTDPINAADRYEAGQLIVRQGDVITPKVKLALDELRDRTEAERVGASAARERARIASEAAAAHQAAETVQRNNHQLMLGLGASLLACLGALMLWWRHRRTASPGTSVVLAGTDDAAWRERALAAEARAEKATELVRANLLPHMARWMMNALVQRLLSQQTATLTTQAEAEREVAALAQRLEQLHIPLEQRLAAYEQRIAELESQLAAQHEQNAELLKAKIETTRKKLQVERAQESPNWN